MFQRLGETAGAHSSIPLVAARQDHDDGPEDGCLPSRRRKKTRCCACCTKQVKIATLAALGALAAALTVFFTVTTVAGIAEIGPQQVHLAYGLVPNTMSVMWVTTTDATDHAVLYGPAGSGNFSAVAPGDTRLLEVIGTGRRNTHVTVMVGIEDGSSYDYKVVQQNPANESQVFTFKYVRKQQHRRWGQGHVCAARALTARGQGHVC